MLIELTTEELLELFPLGTKPTRASYCDDPVAKYVRSRTPYNGKRAAIARSLDNRLIYTNRIFIYKKDNPFAGGLPTTEKLQEVIDSNKVLKYLFSNSLYSICISDNPPVFPEEEYHEAYALLTLMTPVIGHHVSRVVHPFFGGYFSNWHTVNTDCGNGVISQLKVDGHSFKSTEQLYMWFKARHFGHIKQADNILKSKNPFVAKEIGRSFELDVEEWDRVSYAYMLRANYGKYKIPKFANALQRTLRLMVESSPVDTEWGTGYGIVTTQCTAPRFYVGKNKLGHALMDLREMLFPDITYTSSPYDSIFEYNGGKHD